MSGAQFGSVHPLLPPVQRSIREVRIIAGTHRSSSSCLQKLAKAFASFSRFLVPSDPAPWGSLAISPPGFALTYHLSLFSLYPANRGCCCSPSCARETSSPSSLWCKPWCQGAALAGCSGLWSRIPMWISGCGHWGICSGRDRGERSASHLLLPCLPHAGSSLGACARKLPRTNQRGEEN